MLPCAKVNDLGLQVPEPFQPVASSMGSVDQADLRGSSSVGRGRTQTMQVCFACWLSPLLSSQSDRHTPSWQWGAASTIGFDIGYALPVPCDRNDGAG